MSEADRGKRIERLDAVLKQAAEAIHKALEDQRRPSECGTVRALLDEANEIRRELGLVSRG